MGLVNKTPFPTYILTKNENNPCVNPSPKIYYPFSKIQLKNPEVLI